MKEKREMQVGASSRSSDGVDLALGWLRKLHVFLARHEPSQLQQHHPNTVGVLPLGQCSHCVHVNLRAERHKWRDVRSHPA